MPKGRRQPLGRRPPQRVPTNRRRPQAQTPSPRKTDRDTPPERHQHAGEGGPRIPLLRGRLRLLCLRSLLFREPLLPSKGPYELPLRYGSSWVSTVGRPRLEVLPSPEVGPGPHFGSPPKPVNPPPNFAFEYLARSSFVTTPQW